MVEYIKEKDSLNTGRKTINEELTRSNNNANTAKIDSAEALLKAIASMDLSESVRNQLNQLIIEGDSSVEAAAARVDEKNVTHDTLKDRIDDGFLGVTSQLNEKTNKGDISVSDINKNLGKLDQTYMTDEFLQQMAGTTPINTVPADYSLTLKKTTYSKVISVNLFDKNSAKNGRLDGTSGEFFEDSTYYTSEYVEVAAGKTMKFSANVARYAFFDASKTYVLGENLSNAVRELLVPEGAFYLRVSFYYTNLDSFMMAVGTLPIGYVPFQMAISGKYLTDLSGDILTDNSVSEKKTTFFEVGKNLANPDNLIVGYYVSSTDGSLKANNDYSVYHMLPIINLEEYSYNFDGQIAFYNEDKTFISGIFGGGTVTNKTLVVPEGASFASFSSKNPNTFQIEKGSVVTNYEPYALKIKKSLVPSDESNPDNELSINLPSIIYANVGEELVIYNNNFLKYQGYNINYNSQFGKQMSGRYIFTPTVSGTQALIVEVYDRDKLVASKTVNILTSDERATPLKVMVIGDSTVRTNGFGYVTQRLKDKLSSNIELIGTMGTAPNNWEGRGGWRAATYRTNESYEDVENPFYNPSTSDFDFSYYMTNQGFADVDVVIINLGINDVFSPTVDSVLNARIEEVKIDFNFIINNIKSYNPNIKVALNITIPPNDNQDTFGTSYGAGQTQWRYKYNNFEWVSVLIDEFESKCDVIPIHLAIDTKNDISDGVHPNVDGYNKIGDCVFGYLNSLN